MWRDGFRLDEVIRPPFVTPDLAETLLRAGKSLNFLRECCGDTAFEQSLAASALAAAAARLCHGKVIIAPLILLLNADNATSTIPAAITTMTLSVSEVQQSTR